jgi:hypothetical protein
MEPTRNKPDILHVFRDSQGHMVYRESKDNRANCSRCGGQYHAWATVTRRPDESIEAFHVRALTTRKQSVN